MNKEDYKKELHEKVMQARIKIWKMRFNEKISIAEIDDIMEDLCKQIIK